MSELPASNPSAKSLADLFFSNDLFDRFVRDGIFISEESANGFLTSDDLLAELSCRKVLVIHADLRNRKTTHHKPVIRAIGKAVANKLEFDPATFGAPDGPTIAEALSSLSMSTGLSIVLVIEGIDKLQISRQGRNLLAALKAARDAVNLRVDNPNDACLFVVGFAKDAVSVRSMTAYSEPFYDSYMFSFDNRGMSWSHP